MGILRRLALALLFSSLSLSAWAATILETTDSLELITSSTAAIDYTASWADHTTTAFTPGKSAGQITTATTTTIVSAPAASTQRQIKELTFRNTSTTVNNTLTLQRDVSATNRTMSTVELNPGDWLTIATDGTSEIRNSNGVARLPIEPSLVPREQNRIYQFTRTSGAHEGTGYHYWVGKDNGFPGPFALQAPGVNGFATDCSLASQTTDPNGAAQMGANPLVDPATGSLYLTSIAYSSSLAETLQLVDILWYNTGLTVTTTTEQTFTQPALPARSNNGDANGAGVGAALYALTALGNAAVVTNTTIRYTDQDGNGTNTGTFQAAVGWQAPATPVIGTWMPFALATGDSGIRTIQGITLGTSYTSGTMSLVMYRQLAQLPVPLPVNDTRIIQFPAPGIKIWPNTCLSVIQQSSVNNTTATTFQATYTIRER